MELMWEKNMPTSCIVISQWALPGCAYNLIFYPPQCLVQIILIIILRFVQSRCTQCYEKINWLIVMSLLKMCHFSLFHVIVTCITLRFGVLGNKTSTFIGILYDASGKPCSVLLKWPNAMLRWCAQINVINKSIILYAYVIFKFHTLSCEDLLLQ